MSLLALQQPVAVDLRMIIAISKINNDLERIGDHAVNIAQSAQRLADKPHVKPLIDIPKMAHICQSMLGDAIDSFFNRDSGKALMVCKLDNEIDELNKRIINELAFYMANDNQTIPRAMELLSVSKNLERVADIATNIAEEAIFVSEARTIKHHYNI
jgi:phosphate transport system protein